MHLLSWNVNGLRAMLKKGFSEWLGEQNPDIMCLQETKAQREQLPPSWQEVEGYHTYYASAERKGYSGVAIYSRPRPHKVERSFGDERFDDEGRVLIAYYDEFTLFNVYFPNGGASPERLDYKLGFYESFLAHLTPRIARGESIVLCGDVNTAHGEIDLARPDDNRTVSGFLPEERAWVDRLVASGFLDTFRLFEQDGGHYTWWDMRTRARRRNIGWRIDYFFVTENLRSAIKDAFILPEIQGSDHCPVGLTLAFDGAGRDGSSQTKGS